MSPGSPLFMNVQQKLTVVLLLYCISAGIPTQLFGDDVDRQRPPEWDNLAIGGQFKDRFEPVPSGEN